MEQSEANIHQKCWNKRLKINNTVKFESEASEDIA